MSSLVEHNRAASHATMLAIQRRKQILNLPADRIKKVAIWGRVDDKKLQKCANVFY
jgi:hypothetical protein